MNAQLVIIDPQKDFMDSAGSALPVPGANQDMQRLSAMIARVGKAIETIHVTLDSHRMIHIAHPVVWQNQSGVHPDPFTVISVDNVKSGVWRPCHADTKPRILGGQTMGAYGLWYVEQLAAKGNHPLMIWPPHCLIGTAGHTIQSDLMKALLQWETSQFKPVNYISKGSNPWTEHYGALQAEVPMASDPATGFNKDFLGIVDSADIVVIAGEALSHCVKATVTQLADTIKQETLKKIHILTDCSSAVAPVIDPVSGNVVIDYPAIAQAWLQDMQSRGITLTQSNVFLA